MTARSASKTRRPSALRSTSETNSAPRDERRRSLVDAAFRVLAERGFEGLRTREVAALAEVNIATLHYYFASKEDLIAGVAEELLARFQKLGSSVSLTHPYERVPNELAMIQREFKETPETFAVLNEIWVRASRDPSIAAVCQRIDAAWLDWIGAGIRDGQKQGVFRSTLSADATATLVTAFVRGAVLRLFTDPDEKWLRKASAQLLALLAVEPPVGKRSAGQRRTQAKKPAAKK